MSFSRKSAMMGGAGHIPLGVQSMHGSVKAMQDFEHFLRMICVAEKMNDKEANEFIKEQMHIKGFLWTPVSVRDQKSKRLIFTDRG